MDETKAAQNTTAAGPAVAPAAAAAYASVPPGDRTTLYGSVMNRLTVAQAITGDHMQLASFETEVCDLPGWV
jgi:hypothetical protein